MGNREEVPFVSVVYYRASGNFVSRSVVGETVLVPVGEQTRKLNGFATFSETGQFLWDRIAKGKCTEGDLVSGLLGEYDCPEAEAKSDVHAFLEKMLQNGMIETCE